MADIIITVSGKGPRGIQGIQGVFEDVPAADVKTKYESNTDTNAYTDAELAKVATNTLANNYTLPTEINIGGNRALASVDGYAVYADNSLSLPAIGISSGAVVGGNDVNVRSGGKITLTGAGWTPNGVIYLSTNGTLTQTEPITGLSQTIGKAHTSEIIIINIGKPIILA